MAEQKRNEVNLRMNNNLCVNNNLTTNKMIKYGFVILALFLIATVVSYLVLPTFAETGGWSYKATELAKTIRKAGYALCSLGIALNGLKIVYGGVDEAAKARRTVIHLLIAVIAMAVLPAILTTAKSTYRGGGWTVDHLK